MPPSEVLAPHPPSYCADMEMPPQAQEVGDDLPTYSRIRGTPPSTPCESKYSATLKRSRGTCVELVLLAKQGDSVPTYTEGEPVRGKVVLNLPKAKTIHEVTVAARGSVVSFENSIDYETFLDVPATLWTPSSLTTVRIPGRDVASSSETIPAQSRNLCGTFEWPFSIDLPKEVVAPYGYRKQVGIFKLPQTFLERRARISIIYEVCLRIRRGRFTSDYRITLNFGYIPVTRPRPPSLLRQLAYQAEIPIPSPDLDPEGWYTASSIQLGGRLFGRAATVTCTLSLPKPLSYTRGTVIPISLLLESDDSQALDLLSSPRAITSRLRRVTKYCAGQRRTFDLLGSKDAIEDSQLASWWPCSESSSDSSHRRRISGELPVQKDAKPTSAIANFRIEYSLVLLAFDAIAFRATTHTSGPLISIPVEVATMHGRGPQPRMYAPPSYESTDTRYIGPRFSYCEVQCAL